MTDQERQLLQSLIQRVQNAPPPQIDPEAADLIRRGLGTRPDALYILAQSVLLQEIALNQARSQSPGFLGNQGGGYQSGGYQGSGYQGGAYQSGGYPNAPQPDPPQQRSGFSGFLHNAAQTAAGIVAGEVAFSAISSIFGHHGGGGFGGGSGFLGSGGGETIVNNYYEGGNERPLDHGLSPDLEDRRSSFLDDSSDNSSQDDDLSSDDSSSYDDGSDSSDV